MTKRILAAILTAALVIALSACGNGSQTVSSNTPAPSDTPEVSPSAGVSAVRYTADGKRIITIGTWSDIYYVSKHTSIYDDPTVPHLSDDDDEETKAEKEHRIQIAELRLAKLREVELKYNVVIEYVNLTFEGIQESIRTSIAEGIPDVDIYQVDSQFGIPAVLDGLAIALEDIGLANTDVFNEQAVTKNLKLAGQDKSYLFNPSNSGGVSSYPLAFNLDMVEAAGLENPQDLFDRGEWTWDVWENYLKVLTVDADEDGTPEVYGYSGYWTNMLNNLLMSNDAGIARGEKQTMDSKETREVFDFIYKIYNTDKTARPWDSANWEINNKLYAEGLSAFWIGADWIFDQQGGNDLPFEIGIVPWPCGPSGDPATNHYSSPDMNWYMLPKGAEDSELIYNVIFDWLNWYDFDTEKADDYDWSRERYGSERNFAYALMMSQRQGFDLWDSLSKIVNFSLVYLMTGAQNTTQFIESYADAYQNALNAYFTN
ncbi:MAG: hypothetical protein LBN43_07950 [Oscillospiraceae bacterium]|jgi:hypothetical protein|nr:hypothetical protein [Oscillospiraceae bacterium]